MIKLILIIAVSLLAISGICELIHSICILMVMPKRPINNFCVLYLDSINAYYQIRFAVEQVRWQSNNFAEKIIAVTDEADDEQLKKCKILAAENGIILCPSDVLPNVIKSISE